MKGFMAVILCVCLIGCSANFSYSNKEFQNSVEAMIKDGKTSTIQLKSLAAFDWENVYLFTPYTTQETINERLGFDFKDPSGLDKRDDINLLVFTEKDKVVLYAEISRSYADVSLQKTDLIINQY